MQHGFAPLHSEIRNRFQEDLVFDALAGDPKRTSMCRSSEHQPRKAFLVMPSGKLQSRAKSRSNIRNWEPATEASLIGTASLSQAAQIPGSPFPASHPPSTAGTLIARVIP